ncbi:hypothetical protein, partial [Bradyrhizobium elkanii]|uniref:hypothetical protein n=1 Tax=Bradyrhizobium elkanii TaxID=29448 RepID=UPI001AEDDCB1
SGLANFSEASGLVRSRWDAQNSAARSSTLFKIRTQEGSVQSDPIVLAINLPQKTGRHCWEAAKLVGGSSKYLDRNNGADAIRCSRQPLKDFACAAKAGDSAWRRRPIDLLKYMCCMKETPCVLQLTGGFLVRPLNCRHLPCRLQTANIRSSL